jgi:hypothetical protein
MNIDPKKIRVIVQVGLTVVLLPTTVYSIINEPAESAKLKWAFGIVGLLIGYWLK